MRRVLAAGAVVRDPAGRLLLVQRGKDPEAGRWTIPGGRVEPGETPAAAAAREVAEETGLDVAVGREWLVLERPAGAETLFEIHDFVADLVGGTLRAGDDAADVGWFAPADLARLSLTTDLLAHLDAAGLVDPGATDRGRPDPHGDPAPWPGHPVYAEGMTTAQATPSSQPFTIDGQLCFALHSASRAMTACYRQGLETLGLTYSQYAVMLVLWQEEAVSMGSLCEQLHLDSGTLSPLLKRLEKQGRVTRRRRPEDERTLEIACTEEGRALREKARDVQREVERATGMESGELGALREQLNELAERLRTATALHEGHV